MMMKLEEVISSLQSEIDQRVEFITKHLALGESHMVDFFVKDHWKTLVDPDARSQLLECDESDLFSVKKMLKEYSFSDCGKKSGSFVITELQKYFTAARECAVEYSQFCCNLRQVESELEVAADAGDEHCDQFTFPISTKEYMCNKKSHEVEEMSRFVNAISRNLDVSHILDMGSGKGYLGTYLSLRYRLDVIGVDCSESNSASAQSRSQKFLNYWNKHLKNKTEFHFKKSDMKYMPVTAHIDSESDLNEIFTGAAKEEDSKLVERVVLTGLHACGDLTPTALRIFIARPEVKGLCVVGCCYHQLTSDEIDGIEKGFPMSNYLKEKKFTLGRNTRMLGLKAPDRIQSTDMKTTEEKSSRSLFYRAVLSVILEKEFCLDSGSKELRVGKEYSKSKDFVDYVRRSLQKLKVPEDKAAALSEQQIKSYIQSMEPLRKTLLAFSILREAFGPAVEALILLDKLLYLKEQELGTCTMKSYLIRLFDPIKSPRCYALVAMKR